MTEGKNADDDKNEDGKMRMIKCGWKKADEKMQMTMSVR